MTYLQAGIYNTIVRCFKQEQRNTFALNEISNKPISEGFCDQATFDTILQELVDLEKVSISNNQVTLLVESPEFVSKKI